MRSFEIALLELKRLVSARPFRLAVGVVCLVPLLYGVLYLWAFWDPYQRLDRLPVALVVEDRPAMAAGTTLHVGADLTQQLRKSESFDWQVVSARGGRARPPERPLLHVAHRPARLQRAAGARRQPSPATRRAAGARQRGQQPPRQPDRRTRLPRDPDVARAGDVTALRGPRVRRARRHPLRRGARLARRRTAVDRAARASSGSSTLAGGLASADSGARTLHSGLSALSKGAGRLKTGAAKAAAAPAASRPA